MIIRCANSAHHAVDLTKRVVHSPSGDFPFESAKLYTTEAKFYRNAAVLTIKGIVEVQGSPLDVKIETEHTLFWTSSSVYELDEEGKRIRRLAGLNPAEHPDADWRSFDALSGLFIGGRLSILWDKNDYSNALTTSTVHTVSTPRDRRLKAAIDRVTAQREQVKGAIITRLAEEPKLLDTLVERLMDLEDPAKIVDWK